MTKRLKEKFCEADDRLYKIVETETAYKAFVLQDDGGLKEVSPGRIMAVGTPISETEFLKAQTAAKSRGVKLPFQSFRKPTLNA
jgi:hypothetical protein